MQATSTSGSARRPGLSGGMSSDQSAAAFYRGLLERVSCDRTHCHHGRHPWAHSVELISFASECPILNEAAWREGSPVNRNKRVEDTAAENRCMPDGNIGSLLWMQHDSLARRDRE
jgi:hypothetical protein